MTRLKTNAWIGLLAVAAGSGCVTTVLKHPLVKPEKARAAKDFYGVFCMKEEDGARSFLHIGPAGDEFPSGFFRVVAIQHDSTGVPQRADHDLIGFIEPMGKYYLIHIPLILDPDEIDVDEEDAADAAGDGKRPIDLARAGFELYSRLWEDEWKPDQVVAYWLLGLKKTPDGFQVFPINDGFVRQAILDKTIEGALGRGVAMREPDNVITADPQATRAFFAKHLPGELLARPSKETPELRYVRIAEKRD